MLEKGDLPVDFAGDSAGGFRRGFRRWISPGIPPVDLAGG
jgi:hypothetical protein